MLPNRGVKPLLRSELPAGQKGVDEFDVGGAGEVVGAVPFVEAEVAFVFPAGPREAGFFQLAYEVAVICEALAFGALTGWEEGCRLVPWLTVWNGELC